MEIAEYFASFGVRVDPKELRKVDMALLAIERKIRAWQKKQSANPAFRISNFAVDDTRLRFVLGNALDRASNRVVFEIARFRVRPGAINQAVQRASGSMVVPVGVAGRRQPGAVGGGGAGGRNPSFMHYAGGAGLGLMGIRPYGPMAATGIAGYMGFRSLSAINQRNQELMSARISTRAVSSMFGGDEATGDKSFDWLRAQGKRLGFSYLDASQGYNSFMANALGSGMSDSQGQAIFKGFTEFSKVQGTSPAKMKLVNQALGQMMGKGTLNMEELKRQMAESLPGTIPMFAAAYQKMTKGNLTGQKSIAKLLDDIPKGNIKSAEILPLVAELMSDRSQGALAQAVRTSASEQERFQNTIDDLLILAQPKTEAAFSRLFRSFSSNLEKATPFLLGMSEGFDMISKTLSGGLNLIGNVVEGWTLLDSALNNVGQNLLGIDVSVGKIAAGSILLLNPWVRLAAIVSGIVLAIDDIAEFMKGNPKTVTGDLVGAVKAGHDARSLARLKNQRADARAILNTPAIELTPEITKKLIGFLEPNILDLADPTAESSARMVLFADSLDPKNLTHLQNVARESLTANLTPERRAQLEIRAEQERNALLSNRQKVLSESSISAENSNRGPATLSQRAGGESKININMTVTGETTEEALEKVKEQGKDMLEEMTREALTQFQINSN